MNPAPCFFQQTGLRAIKKHLSLIQGQMRTICGTTLFDVKITPNSSECQHTLHPITPVLRRSILRKTLFPAPSVVHLSDPLFRRVPILPSSLQARNTVLSPHHWFNNSIITFREFCQYFFQKNFSLPPCTAQCCLPSA